MTEIDRDGHTAEDIVEAELRRHGREVLNLNRDIVGHYPLVEGCLTSRNPLIAYGGPPAGVLCRKRRSI
jgi:hypothetical protein